MSITVQGEDEDVVLSSPGEALFYGLCHFHEIPVQALSWTASAEANGLCYRPAFWVSVPELGLKLAVEVSDGEDEGTMRPLREAWRGSFRKPLAVVYREQLYDLREASRPAQFTARLKRMAGRVL